MGKIISFAELASLRAQHPEKKIVHCHGVFDLFHYGHLLHLKSAKTFGDLLVVTVTPDQFVNKGPGRPRYSEQHRTLMLAALEAVDYVAINQTPKAIEAIKTLRPHFYAKGPDYRDKQKDITGGILEEEDAVHSIGGNIVFTLDETASSTELINQYFSRWTDAQTQVIQKINNSTSIEKIIGLVDSLSKLRVLVIGEPIIDTYLFCQPEGLSSKSPTVSARFLAEENYTGGSLAIANHLRALGCEVSLLITHGEESFFEEMLSPLRENGIKIHSHLTPGIPTPRKSRYLVPFKAQRIFELIDLRADQWLHLDPLPFCEKMISLSQDQDLVILADFGHGLFEGTTLNAVHDISTFKALNVQTNSGNFGFNPFTKHKSYNYMSIDERECRLATHDRFTPIEQLARKTVKEKLGGNASITLGTAGSIYFNPKGEEFLCPNFFSDVIDTTGAGDAYFALTSLLAKKETAGEIISFLGNCYAGLKTRIIGNKSAVSKVDFIKTIQSILK